MRRAGIPVHQAGKPVQASMAYQADATDPPVSAGLRVASAKAAYDCEEKDG